MGHVFLQDEFACGSFHSLADTHTHTFVCVHTMHMHAIPQKKTPYSAWTVFSHEWICAGMSTIHYGWLVKKQTISPWLISPIKRLQSAQCMLWYLCLSCPIQNMKGLTYEVNPKRPKLCVPFKYSWGPSIVGALSTPTRLKGLMSFTEHKLQQIL